MFPKIIRAGRIWYNGGVTPPHSVSQHHQNADSQSRPASGDADNEDDDERYTIERVPTNPEDFPAAEGNEVPQEPIQPVPTRETRPGPNADTGPNAGAEEEEDSGTGFDLLFVRWSLVVDSLVTLFAGFSTAGWQVYLAGFLLPFASGSAPAAKGVMTELCPPAQRPDAISAITLVESSAMLATQGLFGLIFAAFSDMGRPSLTFFCNAVSGYFCSVILFLLPRTNAHGYLLRRPYNGSEMKSKYSRGTCKSSPVFVFVAPHSHRLPHFPNNPYTPRSKHEDSPGPNPSPNSKFQPFSSSLIILAQSNAHRYVKLRPISTQ